MQLTLSTSTLPVAPPTTFHAVTPRLIYKNEIKQQVMSLEIGEDEDSFWLFNPTSGLERAIRLIEHCSSQDSGILS